MTAHGVRDGLVGEPGREGLRVEVLAFVGFMGGIGARGVDEGWAAGGPGAAEGGVALFLDVGDFQTLERRDPVVHGVVVVPFVAAAVEENNGSGEGVVVFDYCSAVAVSINAREALWLEAGCLCPCLYPCCRCGPLRRRCVDLRRSA